MQHNTKTKRGILLYIDSSQGSFLVIIHKSHVARGIEWHSAVVLKLGSTEPQGFGEAVAGVRLRSE